MNTREKIMRVLEDNPSGLSISDLARKTELHRNTISPNVAELMREGKLKYKMVGQAKVYYLSHDHGLHGGIKMEKGKNVYAGVGISGNDDSYLAGKEAAEMAVKECGKSPDFAFVFCGSNFNANKINEGLKEILNDCKYIGSTTFGEISTQGFSKHSCVVLAISSKFIRIGMGLGEHVLKNPREATEKAIMQALDDIKVDKYIDPYVNYLAMKTKKPSELIKMRPYSVLVFTPGVGLIPVNEDEVISTLNEIIGRYVPIIGPGAASDEIFVNKKLFFNGDVYEDAIISLCIVSDVKIGFGLAHGFKPRKESAYITKMSDHEIIELNNEPAVQRYKELTGIDLTKWCLSPETMQSPEASLFLKHPFALQTVSGNYIIRQILAEKPQDTLRFSFTVPKDARLVPMSGELTEIAKAGEESVKKAINDAGSDNIAAVLTFSCCLRQMVQGMETAKEIEYIKNVVGDAPLAGFYAAGEISFFEDSPIVSQQGSIVSIVITDTLLSED